MALILTNGPRQANLVLIAYASSEGSGEPAHSRSLARTFAARSYRQWIKRNRLTESQIPGPSEWLGMRSWNLSWRNARRHKFAWRGSNRGSTLVIIMIIVLVQALSKKLSKTLIVFFCGLEGYQNENTVFFQMDRDKRIWYLSHMRAAEVQASLRIRAVSPELPLLAHTSRKSRGTFRQKPRSLAPLNGWACAVKICNDGMLEDTNSLDGAQIPTGTLSILLHQTCLGWLFYWL